MTVQVGVRPEGEVFVVTLNDVARRNALSLEMRQELCVRLRELMDEKACRAIVITGAGGQFCVGGDVNQMQVRTADESRARLALVHDLIRLVVAGPKPVVTAIEGSAAGGGVSIVAGSDYAVAATNARFASSFLRAGVLPDMGALWTVPHRIGLTEARRFFTLGRILSGEEAARLGLVDQAVEPGRALATAIGVAAEYSAVPPQTFAMYKDALANRAATFEDALAAELDYQPRLLLTSDQREAVAAFLEKRKPQFNGR